MLLAHFHGRSYDVGMKLVSASLNKEVSSSAEQPSLSASVVSRSSGAHRVWEKSAIARVGVFILEIFLPSLQAIIVKGKT